MLSRVLLAAAATIALAIDAAPARAACGCMVSLVRQRPADTGHAVAAKPELIMDHSRVALVRDGDHTVMTMANDVRETDVRNFALIVPMPIAPSRESVRVTDPAIFQDIDLATRAHFTHVVDPDPCPRPPSIGNTLAGDSADKMATQSSGPSSSRVRPADFGVTVEEHFDVGEYDIAVLSATESTGLIDWLRRFKYDVPRSAADVIATYLAQGMHFFVARVSAARTKGHAFLRPLQVEYDSPKFVLPIRFGMVNADGPQELLVFGLSKAGRIEPTNYRLVKLPTDVELSGASWSQRRDLEREMFLHASEREQQRVVFLGHAGPARQKDNPGAPELPLADFGAKWSTIDEQTGSVAEPTYVTRMQFRYDSATFPEDLVLQQTTDTSSFSQSFTVRDEAGFIGDCPAGRAYATTLPARRDAQARAVAELTGRDFTTERGHLGPPSPVLVDAGVAVDAGAASVTPASGGCASCASASAAAWWLAALGVAVRRLRPRVAR